MRDATATALESAKPKHRYTEFRVLHVLNSLGPTLGKSTEVPQKKSPDFKIEGSTRPQCLGRTWLEAHYYVLFGPLSTWSGSSNALHLKPCTFCERKQRTEWGGVLLQRIQVRHWNDINSSVLALAPKS